MIRVDIELSVPAAGKDGVLLTAEIVADLRNRIEGVGGVVHRLTVEQEDA